MMGKKLVLAGDHLQLGPTIKCKQAEIEGLGNTLFDRVANHVYLKQTMKMLKIQHRMHTRIMDFFGTELYGN